MISIETFKTIETTKDLEQLGETLFVADQDRYEQYLINPLLKYGYDAFPYDGCDPYEMESSRNYRYKFIEIGFPNDSVGLFFKTYNMYGRTGSYMWIKPISKSNDFDNEKEVFEHILKHNLIENCLIPQCIPQIDYSNLNIRNDEYYCNTFERYKEISKSKFRSKKGINKLKNEYHIEMKVNDYDPDEIQLIRYHWWKLHKKQNNKFDKTIDALLNLPQDKRIVLTWELDGKTLGFTIVTEYFKGQHIGKYFRIIQNTNLLKTELDTYDKFIRAHLADLMHWDTIAYLDALSQETSQSYTYIGDAHGAGAFLKPYKARNFKLHNYNYDLPVISYSKLYEEVD